MTSRVNRRVNAAGAVFCSSCHLWKDATDFHAKTDKLGAGYAYYCKPCLSEKARAAWASSKEGREPQRRRRVAGDGSIWCPSCEKRLAPEAFRYHERRGKREAKSYCQACEDAKRIARRVKDARKLPAVTNETRKPARVVSVPITLALAHPAKIVAPKPKPSRAVAPLAADESRKAPITERVCAVCEKRQPIECFPFRGRLRRLTCQSCLYPNAVSPVVATPKPAPVVLAPRPAKPIVYPRAKREECIHAARICWADDARALAAHIHQQGIAPGIVRGFFATVSDDEHEYCRPMFERPGLAALFDELMKAKYGIRDEREAA